MNEPKQPPVGENRKLLENPIVGSLTVPIAIVLIGALIIFGVTKMLSTDRSYRDLVNELHSKTFGNRWIAAYELSKQISAKNIPSEEVPWLITNLSEVYNDAVDPRTRDFIIVALGTLRNEQTLPLILKGLSDKDPNVQFHSMVAIGNMPLDFKIDWGPILKTMRETSDEGLRQAAILAVATHKLEEGKKDLVGFLSSASLSIRYAAALGLINFKEESSIAVLEEILKLAPASGKAVTGKLDVNQTMGLQLNIISALQKNKWTKLNVALGNLVKNSHNKKVVVKAQETLNLLKN
ncbi:MAG: HEAT repeat domain-containing protein [Bacteriovoracaceae bacterium]|nr:HEAT repeat domain-containing protein [Bacteriovoracaceae bacterium]